MRGIAIISVLLVGCSADPMAPEVSIIAQAPESLVFGSDDEDDVTLRLAFEDADGDLGGGIMHLQDCRDSAMQVELPIPAVASPEDVEEKRSISGELIALLPDVAEAPQDAVFAPPCDELGIQAADDELVFCVVLEDSAGQKSPGACSEPFTFSGP